MDVSDCQMDTSELVTVTKITNRKKTPIVLLDPVYNLFSGEDDAPVSSPFEQTNRPYRSSFRIKMTRLPALPPSGRTTGKAPSRFVESVLAYADAMQNHVGTQSRVSFSSSINGDFKLNPQRVCPLDGLGTAAFATVDRLTKQFLTFAHFIARMDAASRCTILSKDLYLSNLTRSPESYGGQLPNLNMYLTAPTTYLAQPPEE
ncbi:unnamed protein product [Schistocephalus solidus]|uniref:Uncharacterized protein n=1 Tax=Schistocephalus solidus TaxID=70667 RepID=A0A3P7D7S4_SCHSO|nr:unnamed protein product [Schistocephalus solidus]